MRISSQKIAIALFASTFAWMVAAPAGTAAQSSDKKKKADEPQFDRADRPAPKAPARTEVTATDALEAALPVITTWPAPAGEGALRALIARGPEQLVPLLRARLAGGTVLERAAAARGLCLLGDQDSFPAIERLFADARQRRRFTALVDSLYELDPERGAALALRFLESDDSALRTAATTLLRSHATPELVATLEQRLIETRSDGVRLDLFTLLDSLKDPALPALALDRFLGDRDPQLASRVTQLLSWQDSPEIRGELARLARTNRERRGLHAALALALAEQRLGTPTLPDDLFDTMLPALRTSDLLMRATACVVCGMIGYRSEARAEATEEQVLPALADVVVHGRFFGDFELCFQAAVGTLGLLTGERLGASVPAWRDYFAAHANQPLKGHRELKGFVLEEDLPAAIVTLARSDAAGRLTPIFTLCGPGWRSQVSLGQRPGEIVLEEAPMRVLLTGLTEDGLLAGELPRTFDHPVAGGLQLTVEARGRERSVALAAADAHRRAFEARVEHAAATGWWQLLLPSGEGFVNAFAEEQAWCDTHHDPDTRKGRLLDLALTQISSNDLASAHRAFEILTRIDAIGTAVRPAQIDAMSALLSRLPSGDPRARKLFDLLVGTQRADALERLVEALTPRGASAVPWLADALVAFGKIEGSVEDPRPFVRLAALSAVERGSATAVKDDTLVLLADGDPDEQVRGKALKLLARSGTEVAATALIRRASEGDLRSRADALRVLGSVHRDDALAVLVAAARGSDGALAAAALEGLSARGDEAAAEALEGVLRERGPADAFGRLAFMAIKGLPRELALARLRKLLDGGDAAIAREAGYGLADLGEMQAVPTLLTDLEEAKLQRRAQTLLTYLFCKDLGTETWRFRSLYESQPTATHADHFLAALGEAGTIVPDDADVLDRGGVPLLVAAIEDTRWYVRRSALEFLEVATGRSLGSLSVDAGRDEIVQLAQRWREATAIQASGAAGR